MRRCVAVLSVPFPIRAGRKKQNDVYEDGTSNTLNEKKDEFGRMSSFTTRTADGKKETSTYITSDGGRVDFVDLKWPPENLTIREATLPEVQVKYGVPWPSLYFSLDIFRAEVTLRYILDTSFEKLRNLTTAHCPTCFSPDTFTRPLRLDPETQAFARKAIYAPVPPLHHYIYTKLVDFGVYRYTAASWTGNNSVFLTSGEQVGDLLSDYNGTRHTLLDIGAGSGDVTKVWAPFFKEVTATEVSQALVNKLNKIKNVTAHLSDTIEAQYIGNRWDFDVVLCFNILDRCASFTKMLDDAIAAVKPGGRVFIGLPLPLRQAQHRLGALQELLWPPHHTDICAFENAVAWFTSFVLSRYGGSNLKLTRIARCPYLSKGPAKAPLSVLDTAIFVFDKSSNPAPRIKTHQHFSREPTIV